METIIKIGIKLTKIMLFLQEEIRAKLLVVARGRPFVFFSCFQDSNCFTQLK